MSAPLNDVGLAAFDSAARGSRDDLTGLSASTLVAGVFCGLAIGVKYPALVLTGLFTRRPIISPLVDRAWRSRTCWLRRWARGGIHGGSRRRGRYLRAYSTREIPSIRSSRAGSAVRGSRKSSRRSSVPLAPIPGSSRRARPADARAGAVRQLRPPVRAGLPALLPGPPPRARVAWRAPDCRLGYLFLVLCMTQRQSMRFLLVALGPMSVGVAYLGARWTSAAPYPPRYYVIPVVVLGLETGLSVTGARGRAGAVLGKETIQEFLGRNEPTYRVGRWVRHLPASARLIGQDLAGSTSPRHYPLELAHRRRTDWAGARVPPRTSTPEEGRLHPRHALPAVPQEAVEFDPTLGRMLARGCPAAVRSIARISPIPTESCDDTPSTSSSITPWPGEPKSLMSQRHPTLGELRATVQKGRHREIGNWLARRWGRPSAIYGTWLAVRLGLSAHQVTLAVLLRGSLGGAVAIGTGTDGGLPHRRRAGASRLLARSRRRPGRSLAQVPRAWMASITTTSCTISSQSGRLGFALGYGLACTVGPPGLGPRRVRDRGGVVPARASTMTAATRRSSSGSRALTSSYRVAGGSGGKPAPPAPWPRHGLGMLTWPAYKLCANRTWS